MASGNPQRLSHTAKEEGAEEFTLQNSLYKMSHVISLFLSFLIFKTETFPTASVRTMGTLQWDLRRANTLGTVCPHNDHIGGDQEYLGAVSWTDRVG